MSLSPFNTITCSVHGNVYSLIQSPCKTPSLCCPPSASPGSSSKQSPCLLPCSWCLSLDGHLTYNCILVMIFLKTDGKPTRAKLIPSEGSSSLGSEEVEGWRSLQTRSPMTGGAGDQGAYSKTVILNLIYGCKGDFPLPGPV